MLSSTPEIEGASFVILGSLNPGLFHPSWLAYHGLIREPEAETAENMVVTSDFSRFQTDWFSLEVLPERLMLITNQLAYYNPLRDLAESILNLLPNTPVHSMGMNRSSHYSLKDEVTWHSFGHRLVPKEPMWADIIKDPGTARVAVKGIREDGRSGHLLVIVEPSSRIENGVFVDINDHYSRPDGVESASGSSWATEVIADVWKEHQERVGKIRERLIAFAAEGVE